MPWKSVIVAEDLFGQCDACNKSSEKGYKMLRDLFTDLIKIGWWISPHPCRGTSQKVFYCPDCRVKYGLPRSDGIEV